VSGISYVSFGLKSDPTFNQAHGRAESVGSHC
jgi:hypothetical protein